MKEVLKIVLEVVMLKSELMINHNFHSLFK